MFALEPTEYPLSGSGQRVKRDWWGISKGSCHQQKPLQVDRRGVGGEWHTQKDGLHGPCALF